MMRYVRQRLPVTFFCLCEFFKSLVHARKCPRMGFLKAPEPVSVAPIELDKASSCYALDNELEIYRAHRKEKVKSQASPKVHGHVSPGRIGIIRSPLEDVGLAFAGPPFVLSGEFNRSHLVHQLDQAFHQGSFRTKLWGSQRVIRVSRLPFFPSIQVVIRFEAPQAAVDPLAEFSATPE